MLKVYVYVFVNNRFDPYFTYFTYFIDFQNLKIGNCLVSSFIFNASQQGKMLTM